MQQKRYDGRGDRELRPSSYQHDFQACPEGSVLYRCGGTTVLLASHVRAYDLGRVVVSPIDVVLDAERALVVQPDIVFVSNERLSIIRNQIWGAPDLVVEVLSAGTQRRDRTKKVGWYREYGVRECWLVDESAQRVEIYELQSPRRVRRFGSQRRIRSTVLPQLTFRTGVIFRA